MSNGPQTTVVMVTYQSESTVGAALASLRRCHDRALARVVIVDNASDDGTKAALERESSWVTVVHSPGNIGFGRGCNLGLTHVHTPYVTFVNPDAEFEPEACVVMVDFHVSHPNAGIISPAMVRSDQSLQQVGGITTPRTVLRAAAGVFGPPRERRPVEPGQAPFRTDWVCGAALQIPAALLRELGGFDPRFFLYFEETDLCIRVAQRGYEIWALGTALVKHSGGVSAAYTNKARVSGCIAEHFFRSRFYYLRKHFGFVPAAGVEGAELVLYAVRAAGRLARGRSAADLLCRFTWPVFASPARIT